MSGRRRWLRWAGLCAASLAAVLLIGPFLLPLPELDTVPPRELAAPDDRFLSAEGVEVRFRETGSGEQAFLLLHGFGANSRSWTPVMEELGHLGRAAAFDRVGFGLTERPLEWDGQNPYGTDTQVEIALALMDRLGVEEATVVGHSAGAVPATVLALDHPTRVAGLVLESPPLDSGPGSVARFLIGTPQGQRIVRFLGRRAADRVEALLESAYHDPELVSNEILEGYLEPFEADDWDEGLALLSTAPQPGDLRERLDDVEVPVLIVTGGDDTWVTTEETVELAKGVAGADLSVIPECGHVAHEECPGAFLDAIANWLSG